ncbi:acetyl-CoA carboxylase family protein [Microbacterium sp. CPCC 204701]|uniref:acetyl-CoA carboxylase family protein n=1 Tax=Microbacterium sp. CPCC 204701 TaxID=2493084 RepID=UPI000FDB532D|nr:carboxyl transferase domain-containing protein [Microbacterium sp. CPCC 204701]
MTRDVVLIANRGEVAVRINRAAEALGIEAVAVFSADDAGAMHRRVADRATPLEGIGATAYLDVEAIVRAASDNGANLLHPGWGFLSEQPELAQRCADAGITFVGPSVRTLELFGDKVQTREVAGSLGVPMVTSTGPTTLDGAERLLADAAPGHGIMLKAVAGGGGRGIRVVKQPDQLEAAFRDCAAEAVNAFGDGRLFAELFIPNSRHIEVQIVGDNTGDVAVLGDRDCSVQRNWQKLVEIAPAPGLPAEIRDQLHDAAAALARAVGFTGVGTFEFLVDADPGADAWYFMEANPRLQVEHTVTEEVTGIDIVQTQFGIARGKTLRDLGLVDFPRAPRGVAIQCRVNAETITSRGVLPSSGTISELTLPEGSEVRVDTGFETGDVLSSRYDSLLAKIIVHEPADDLPSAVARARDAVGSLKVVGVETSQDLLLAILDDPRLAAAALTTRFLEQHLTRSGAAEERAASVDADGHVAVLAETAGIVTHLDVAVGELVEAGDDLVRVEVMKMQHGSLAPVSGRVVEVRVAPGDECLPGAVLVVIDPVDTGEAPTSRRAAKPTGDGMAVELRALSDRRRLAQDSARPQAVERAHARGLLTVREKLTALVDEGSFIELGQLTIAARLWRDTEEDLARRTPADGVVTGTGVLGAAEHAQAPGRCAVIAYDPSVLAGTQGLLGMQKVERLLELAERSLLPIALIADGGGGRPGDEAPGTSANPLRAFHQLARISGRVPIAGMASGACFAGNAALLGCSDVIIATRGANIGMGGPVVVDAARLGSYTVAEIGPAPVLHDAGVVDILADDDADAVARLRRVVGYFQGDLANWECADQELLRSALPTDRLRAYDVRDVLELIADIGSVQELKGGYGPSMVTALARIEGMPVGVIANNPKSNAGAIDQPGADKAARFASLCETFGLPVLFLCDTPGFAVGPEAEAAGQLRELSSFLISGSKLSVPFATVITRKAYGVGAVAMCGGSFRAPWSTIAWPTAEIGSMAPEAIVRLSASKELDAIADETERAAEFDRRVQSAKAKTAPLGAAARFRVDDVIDPADTRALVAAVIRQGRRAAESSADDRR